MKYNKDRALELLRIGSCQPQACFRDEQEEAIQYLVEGKGRLLVVQKTGWGKSFVYFITTKLLREQGKGPVILVSPLLALMRNQIMAAQRMGVVAVTINSDNKEEWNNVTNKVLANRVDILLVSPERFSNVEFNHDLLARIASDVSMFVVDEAHCISDWGHDFRPDYRLLERIIKNFPQNMRLLATTATANDRVMSDLVKILGSDLKVQKGDLNRPSLTLQTIKLPSQAERMAWIAAQLKQIEGSGIIYVLTIQDAERLAKWLKSKRFNVEAYTGKSNGREALENALLKNEIKALIATSALGMGFDKPDLSFVFHYQMPGSIVSYYQQVGRAGRALESAYGVLLSGDEEESINDWFICNAFPSSNEVDEVITVLENASGGLTENELAGLVNMRNKRIDLTLTALSLESPAPVVKQGRKWELTAAKLQPSFEERANRITNLRFEEIDQMKEYVDLPFGEHMKFIVEAFNGDTSNITEPLLQPLPTEVDKKLIIEALAFLKRTTIDIEPRKKWPKLPMQHYGLKANTLIKLPAEKGKALCIWGDAGWGALVQSDRDKGHFSDELVEACVAMLEEWQPVPYPQWVTCVPSMRQSELVSSFAKRLAQSLNLPFKSALVKEKETQPQEMFNNPTLRALNIDGVFGVKTDQIIHQAPVLLVDDLVDSGWTMTIAAGLLRYNRSGPVFPVALASKVN